MESTQEESTEGLAVVRVLATVLDRLVKSNPNINKHEPNQVTKFHALQAPGIDILNYLERIHKYACCSTECYILALIYIDRLIQSNNFNLSELNVHRVVITAVLLAAKFFDDAYYNNAYYAKVGGVLVSEMNGLEVEFLFRINFSLHVKPEVFKKYQAELVSHVLPQEVQNEPKIETHTPSNIIAYEPSEPITCPTVNQSLVVEETSVPSTQSSDCDWYPKAHQIRRHITPSPTQTINHATNPSDDMYDFPVPSEPAIISSTTSHLQGNNWNKFDQNHQIHTPAVVGNTSHHIHQPLSTMLQYATAKPSSPRFVTATTDILYR